MTFEVWGEQELRREIEEEKYQAWKAKVQAEMQKHMTDKYGWKGYDIR